MPELGECEDDPQAIAAAEFAALRLKRDALIEEVIGADALATYEEARRYQEAELRMAERPGRSTEFDAEELWQNRLRFARELDVHECEYEPTSRTIAARCDGDGFLRWFDSPDPSDVELWGYTRFAGRYRIEASVLQGPSIGDARLTVNGQIAHEFKSTSATEATFADVSLGEHELGTGRFVVRVLVEARSHSSHGSGVRFGIDRFRLVAVGDLATWMRETDLLASNSGLDPARLRRFAEMVPRSKYVGSDADPRGDYRSIEEFSDGGGGWSARGFAFGLDPHRDNRSLVRPHRIASGIAHSALESEFLAGTLVSRSFTIHLPWLLVRAKGEGGSIRVVIDSDVPSRSNDVRPQTEYRIAIDGGDTWTWKFLDLAPHVGGAAWIEVWDEGTGWVAVDHVGLSDSEGLSWPARRSYVIRCSRPPTTPESARAHLLHDGRFVFSDPRFDAIEAEREAIELRMLAATKR